VPVTRQGKHFSTHAAPGLDQQPLSGKGSNAGGGGCSSGPLRQDFAFRQASRKFRTSSNKAAVHYQFGRARLAWCSWRHPAEYKTRHADLPSLMVQKALLTMECWEHAYYLDLPERVLIT